MSTTTSEPVHEFRNGSQLIRTCLSTYRGRLRPDVRLWITPDDGGPPCPTRQGLSIRADHPDAYRLVMEERLRLALLRTQAAVARAQARSAAFQRRRANYRFKQRHGFYRWQGGRSGA